jgi:hypothetical protein
MIEPSPNDERTGEAPIRHARLPGFIQDQKIGLGDAVSRITYALGLKPCGGCTQRAAAMNRWMQVTRWSQQK